jgi:hypothetical protein
MLITDVRMSQISCEKKSTQLVVCPSGKYIQTTAKLHS